MTKLPVLNYLLHILENGRQLKIMLIVMEQTQLSKWLALLNFVFMAAQQLKLLLNGIKQLLPSVALRTKEKFHLPLMNL
nr:MAG TPA: hypothetical protein [Caudoviricetes sp.]